MNQYQQYDFSTDNHSYDAGKIPIEVFITIAIVVVFTILRLWASISLLNGTNKLSSFVFQCLQIILII